MATYLIVNFGGPRNAAEIEPFLRSLLTDRDVIRSRWPDWLHNWFFGRIARKRAPKIAPDYEKIGFSPIFKDTETLKESLAASLGTETISFYRYLPMTHAESLKRIEDCRANEIRVIPLFPQFCFGTTGSAARFLASRLSPNAVQKLRWVRSYADHPTFIEAWKTRIGRFLEECGLKEEDAAFLFSAHGVPRSFIDEGDPYEEECRRSFSLVMSRFPKAVGKLAYQSKFGRGEWLKPYTDEACNDVLSWSEGRKAVVFIPITFTTDHIETLYEIEELYLPLVREKRLEAFRCPCLNLDPEWRLALARIAKEEAKNSTQSLIRTPS